MRRVMVCAGLVLGLLPATARAVTTPAFHDGDGVHVVSVKQLSPRLFALTLTTPLLSAPTNVRVLLPTDYDAQPKRRFPVLWLFHGTSGGAADWTTSGDAEKTTADRELITVMPDAGVNSNGGSWFTDWVGATKEKWETWHIGHLIPWIDAQLRTNATRAGRAIAGLSQGGFGAMSYASRHPDLVSVAASFSGALDISANGLIADPVISPIILATEVGLDQLPPNTFFGDRLSNEINYAAHDPATLAGNLRGMDLFAWTGDGNQGPLDPAANPGGTVIEAGAHELTTLFRQELLKRGIPITYDDYGPGTHSWPYWARDLRQLIGPLMHDFDDPDPAPAAVDYESTDPMWSQWGWTVTMTRPAREFSALLGAGTRGFTLTGSGSGVVTTPPAYRPGAAATVTVAGTPQTLKVAPDGRLTIAVPLGPGNPQQQDTLGATTTVRSARVTISAPAPKAKKPRKPKRHHH